MPQERRKANLAMVVAAGGLRASLEALRDRLADDLDSASDPQDVARLAKGLRETLHELDRLPQSAAVSASDDLARRRADRRSAPQGVAPAVGDLLDGRA